MEQEKQKQSISETAQQWDYDDMIQQEWVSLNAVICRIRRVAAQAIPKSSRMACHGVCIRVWHRHDCFKPVGDVHGIAIGVLLQLVP